MAMTLPSPIMNPSLSWSDYICSILNCLSRGLGDVYKRQILSGAEYPPVVDVPGLCKIGLSICYDVRFPELYRYLSSKGAELIMIPAAFTAFTGKDHWQILLQARAIENTAYVVAPAQTGIHYGRRQSHGHAMVIDPWGTVLSDAGKTQGAAIALL